MNRKQIIIALSLLVCTLVSCQNERKQQYAASPIDHSFTAQFSEMEISECKWKSWSAEDTGFQQTASK